jgi:hypothetical protein
LKADVRFIATSTAIRGTWGNNEDVYLAEFVPNAGAEPVLFRLVDQYPNFMSPLPLDVLTSKTGTMLRITRDAQCDLPYARMSLRTAPGDQRAILRTRLNYRPQLVRTPEPDEVLPCYRTVRSK